LYPLPLAKQDPLYKASLSKETPYMNSAAVAARQVYPCMKETDIRVISLLALARRLKPGSTSRVNQMIAQHPSGELCSPVCGMTKHVDVNKSRLHTHRLLYDEKFNLFVEHQASHEVAWDMHQC
jgi:hypothetical protein